MIEKTLILLGLKEKEVAIYLEIMKLGKTTPAQVATISGINRATVYSVCKSLIKKGLIEEDLGGPTRQLVALPPAELTILVEKEKRRLSRKEELVTQAIAELNDLPLNTQYSIPKIRFIEEENIDLKSEAPKWDESMLKTDPTKTWWGFQDKSFVGLYEDWIDWYWSRAHEDISLKLLSNQNVKEETVMQRHSPRREVKFFDNKTQFTAATWVLGEYLIMLYTKDRPYYMIEIHNPTLAHNYRELFKNIWEKY